MEIVSVALIMLALVSIGLLIILIRRPVVDAGSADFAVVTGKLEQMEKISREESQRLERALREEIQAQRVELGKGQSDFRGEIALSVKGLSDSLLQQIKSLGDLQKAQLDGFATSIETLRRVNNDTLDAVRRTVEEKVSTLHKEVITKVDVLRDDSGKTARELQAGVATSLKNSNDSVVKAQGEIAQLQKAQLESFSRSIQELTKTNETRHELLRATVEKKLTEIQGGNEKKLEEMRQTVDEKLQGTLEKRLGESFKLVSERLEQVQKGLGEMQTLANGVGDLKKVLSNVKARGTWGEIQLGAILEEMLSPEQFERNVRVRPRSPEVVEFAVKLPGSEEGGALYLPIDSKFPKEDYERLQQAQERGDPVAAEEASAALEAQIRKCARDIRDKYIHPPYSTDFGILFVPVESLYAEILRRPGLAASLQTEHRVIVAGPTTFAALLNSLQMGFRTLAIQKRSSEVWKVLGAVKAEFGKFTDLLDKVGKHLQTAQNTIGAAASKSRNIQSKLRSVEDLPPAEAVLLLGVDSSDDVPAEAAVGDMVAGE